MSDVKKLEAVLAKVRLASPNLYEEGADALARMEGRIGWLTGALHARVAEVAYATECEARGADCDWDSLSDDLKQSWADHVEADVKAELEKAGIPLG